MLRDSKGNTWIGTLGQGLARLRATSYSVPNMERFSEANGLSTAFVWCLLEDREHNIWVGTQNGLNRFRDEKITTLTRSEGLVNDDVGALAAGPDGSVWASTSVGIGRIDGGHRNLYLDSVSAMGLSVEPTNRLWAGTQRGVGSMEDGKWAYFPMPTGNRLTDVTAIIEDDGKGIRGVHAGKRCLPASLAQKLAEHIVDDPISPREVEVLSLMAAGRRNKEIASELSIAEDTVKMHVRNILSKLQVNDRTEAVTIALRRGIIQL